MKAIGIALLVVGLVVAVLPVFNTCSYDGKAITLPNGKTVEMKCLWTARASLVTGVTLAFVGLFLALSKRRESRLMLSVIAALLSAFAISLPTALIGVCKMDANCVNVMKPSLIAAGALGVLLSVVALVLAWRQSDETPPSQGATA